MSASATPPGHGAPPSPAWPLSPEALLAESRWVRRLAGRLLRDPGLADDLVQEVWVRALERPQASDGVPRSWLAGVARNLARQEKRERTRRDERERTAARGEAQPSALDALDRLQRQRGLVDALLALEEPYRSTIVLRFYEGLPPRRIAARDGVPVATVKTRLARGLAQLRTRLDQEHGGDGRSWALFLLPLARPRGIVPLVTGVVAVSMLVKLAVVAATLAGALLWIRGRASDPASPALAAVAEEGALAAPVAPREPAGARAQPAAVREALAPPASTPETPTVLAPELVRGRVIDVAGLPVAGVELGFRTGGGSSFDEIGFDATIWKEDLRTDLEPVAVSGRDGRFEFPPLEGRSGSLVSQDERWESVLTQYLLRPEDERVVVVAPLFRLEGTVVDGYGTPLAGVDLRFGVPPDRYQGCGVDLSGADVGDWHATSDERGRFALERLPSVAGAILRARHERFETARIERELWSDDALEIVLERPEGTWLAGIVVARGAPVAGATVVLGFTVTKTDERGEFELHLEGELARESELRAAATGFLPASLSAAVDATGRPSWPAYVQLELAGEPLALEGIVVDAEGRPRSGQEVWLTSGRTVLWDEFPVLLESILAGAPNNGRFGAISDADGRFRIAGLEARDYGLRVVDPKTALVADVGPFAAGSKDLRLRQPTDEVWPEVRGVVVSRAGKPLPGCRVSVVRVVDHVGLPERSFFGFEVQGSSSVPADESGAFVLHGVPKQGVALRVDGGEFVDPEFRLGPDVDPLDLCITVGLWVSLEVRVAHEPRANAIGALDARGEPVMLRIPLGSSIMMASVAGIVDGRSPVVSVGDDATTLVLYSGEEELERVPLVLLPDRVNVVDL